MSNIGQIYILIPKIMEAIGGVSKSRKNEQQGYKFRGIEDFYKAAHPALVANGVFCCPQVLEHESTERATTNASGKPTVVFRVIMKVSHRFYAPDGSYVEVITCGEGIDNSDKATNKAMSGAMKYALIELFSVPTEDVEDGDRTSPEAGYRKGPPVATTEKEIEIRKPGRAMDDPRYAPDNAKERMTHADVVKANGGLGQAAASSPAPAAPTLNGLESFAISHTLEELKAKLEDLPALINEKQQGHLRGRFRESLPEELRANSEVLLHDFLGYHKFIGTDGNPHLHLIPETEFKRVGKLAVAHAKSLGGDSIGF